MAGFCYYPHFTGMWREILKRASQEWQDINLKWNKSDYGQIGDIRIPPKYIWKPDLLMYNRSVRSICNFDHSLFAVLTKLLTGRITRM